MDSVPGACVYGASAASEDKRLLVGLGWGGDKGHHSSYLTLSAQLTDRLGNSLSSLAARRRDCSSLLCGGERG